jgi:hypothetical protein
MASLAPAEKAPAGKPLKVGSPHDPAEREAALTLASSQASLPACTACSAGGVPCAACGGGGGPEVLRRRMEADRLPRLPVQRKCASCAEKPRPAGAVHGQNGSVNDEQLMASILQRRADSSNSTAFNGERDPLTGLGAGRALNRGERSYFEPRFGRPLDAVRVHDGTQAAHAARAYAARAYTFGQNIVFGEGEFRPGTREGRELLAHELAHTVQQGDGKVQPKAHMEVSNPGDPLEREADAMAKAALDDKAQDKPLASPASGVQRSSLIGDLAAGVTSLVDDPVGTMGGALDAVTNVATIPSNTLETVNSIASALGGSVSISGWTLTITVSGVEMPWMLTVQPELADFLHSGLSLPVLEWPIGPNLVIQGAVGVEVGLRPLLGLQLGPGRLNSLTIVIDASALSTRMNADVEFTVAGQLGAEAHADVFGEVSLLTMIPPDIPIAIPLATIEAGFSAQILGTAITTTHATGSSRADLSGLALSAHTQTDLGVGLAYGIGGYGSLNVLGVNLCTLFWPLWRDRKDIVIAFDVDAGLVIDAAGLRGDFAISDPMPSGLDFDDLPLALPEHVLVDNCYLCEAATALGVFPLDNLGGGWANWTPPVLSGPLANTYIRNPGFASGAECRGACGPDCFSCDELGDAIVCEDLGPAGTQLWLYERLAVCPTHEGCRQHDGGFDWCGSLGEMTIFGPCHRLPDFEAVCSHGVANAVGWIIGMPPHDPDPLFFADGAAPLAIINAPCPEDAIDPANPPRPSLRNRFCLDDITLVDEHSVDEAAVDATRNQPILAEPIIVPIYGPIVLVIIPYVRGEFFAFVSGTFGPVELIDICAVVDVGNPSLSGEATLRTNMALVGSVGAVGILGADVNLDCLVPIANLEGGLSLTGSAVLANQIDQRIEVTIDSDGIAYDADLSFNPCLNFGINLDAMLNLSLLGFRIWGGNWNLAGWQWERCWQLGVGTGGGSSGPQPDRAGVSSPSALASAASSSVPTDFGHAFSAAQLLQSPFATANAITTSPSANLSTDLQNVVQTACIHEPEAEAPDGWTPNEPIEMRWFKDENYSGLYPNPIELEQPSGMKNYYQDRPDMVQPEGQLIGVTYWPRQGDPMTYSSTYNRDRRQAREFRALLARHGFDWGGRRYLQADHVHDLMWGGGDQFANLWPADGSFNGYAGLCQNIVQYVTYASWPSGEVVTTPIYMACQEARQRQRERYFVIKEVKFGGCR